MGCATGRDGADPGGARKTLGDSQQMPGYGTQMSLKAADVGSFVAGLYPVARNGFLKLTYPETDSSEVFPIVDFLFAADNTSPIGLLVNAPNLHTFFIKPFNGTDEADAVVLKDDIPIGTLLGVQFPATLSEG